ncbi:AAA family ATPase [Desulfobacterales bacterium HSG2]|nr:AAA family ATPase [Desulfobacterales bacterium HSG2]
MFPYIRQIKVNDCFTFQNFKILSELPDRFKHIIITGKNGSGKTTILNRTGFLLQQSESGVNIQEKVRALKSNIAKNPKDRAVSQWQEELKNFSDVELEFFNEQNQLGLSDNAYNYFRQNRGNYIFSFFRAYRKVRLRDVRTVTRETDFLSRLNNSSDTESFSRQFKQYMVNKKVYEAFDHMNNRTDSANRNRIFFESLTETLRTVFRDRNLSLEFMQENFEFLIKTGDGRKVTFNQLSDGFSAFLSILTDLFMRADLIRKQRNDFRLDPEGIVLIDEPETHSHIEMQYETLPLLESLFPNIQLIIATHSPAIISSLKNAVVHDLTSKKEVSDWVTSGSFSELMITHFGLDSEFSPVADKIIEDFREAYSEKDDEKMTDLMERHKDCLTPSLTLEIESRIAELKGKEE